MCQIFDLISSLSLSTMRRNLRRINLDRFWACLVRRFRFSIVRYINHADKSSWCSVKTVLLMKINSDITIALSESFFCGFSSSISNMYLVVDLKVVDIIMLNECVDQLILKWWMIQQESKCLNDVTIQNAVLLFLNFFVTEFDCERSRMSFIVFNIIWNLM